MPLPAAPAAWLPATVSPGQVLVTCEQEASAESPLAAGLLVVISPGQLDTHMEILLPGNAATSCPEVPSHRRFPVPLPTSSCFCSEPLQHSRFTSHKSVWRGNGSRSSVVPGEGRERPLSLPLQQTLSHRCWSPCGDPDLASPSCVAGEMPKMDQRAMETSRQRFPGGKQAVRCRSQEAGRRATGTLDQRAGIGIVGSQWLFGDPS